MRKFLLSTIIFLAIALLAFILFYYASPKKEHKFIRSVTAVSLKEVNPIDKIKLTGVVEAWRKENLSFELSGKIIWIKDKGMVVGGGNDAYDLAEDGTGDAIAMIDNKKYKLKVKTAEAQLKAAKAKYEAFKIEVNEVLKQQLEALKADYQNRGKEFKRLNKLRKDNVVSQKAYENSETNYKIAFAKYKELQALEIVKNAELIVAKTQIEELDQTVSDAKLDLKKTILHAPYQGKISEVYTNVGAYVKAGDKVVKLVAMDPITVKLDVSPELDRKFNYGEFVNVYPPNQEKPFLAMINRKAVAADPRTHTYEMELLLHNKIAQNELKTPDNKSIIPLIDHLWPIIGIENKKIQKEIQIVMTACIYGDSNQEYLWKAEKLKNQDGAASVFRLKKNQYKNKSQGTQYFWCI